MEKAVTDFPQPDSPTIPRVSPRFIVKFTSSTGVTVPNWVLKLISRLLTSSIFSFINQHSLQLSLVNFGSRASLRPSPRKFTLRTARKIINPGKKVNHQGVTPFAVPRI